MTFAASYIRMSTEQQTHSAALQAEAIAAYAAVRGYRIARSYADEGLSGLTANRRPGLQALMRDCLSGAPGFEVLLVYDVSRLGRFQNPDQAAHYEFLCSEAGVRIEYCAEPFDNDGTMSSVLLKSLKRVMAAEYSRDLSAKVRQAQHALAAAGYWQGGPPGFGLRRQQLLSDGSPGRMLDRGDRKGPHSGRTILVPGPAAEVATVRRIFELYVSSGMAVRSIARTLNLEGVAGPYGPWRPHLIHDILKNGKYIGVNTIAKSRRALGGRTVRQAEDSWISAEGAFEPLVDRGVFERAQARRAHLRHKFTDQELLAGLTRLYKQHGRISARLIDACPDLPSSKRYGDRFDSLLSAYRLAGLPVIWRHQLATDNFTNRQSASRLNQICGRTPGEIVNMMRALLKQRGRLTRPIIDAAFGEGSYLAAARRLGGGRSLYALAGYAPNPHQNRVFDNSPAEPLTEEEAETLRLARFAAPGPAAFDQPDDEYIRSSTVSDPAG